MLTFPVAEFQGRLEKTKSCMVKQGIDVLVVTDPANMNYLSGYDAWSFYVHQALIVFVDELQPYWIGREMDAKAATFTTWLDHDHIIPYEDFYVQSDVRHPMDFISQFLKRKNKGTGRVGLEFDSYYFTAQSFVRLTKGLPDAIFVDGTNLVNWVRMIKSDQEIEYMKKAAKISERAMQAAFDTLQVGVRENDVAASIMFAQVSGTNDYGGDYPAIVPLLPAGKKTSACHLTWTDDVLLDGDAATIELAGCYKRYHSPLARTAVVGNPDEELVRLSEIVKEGIESALQTMKPGVYCEDVEEAWRKTIEKYGVTKESRIGYSVGLNYPPDWGERTASLRPGDRTVLKENMVFHMIPILTDGPRSISMSETVRVTDKGHELLAQFPRELFIKPNIRLA